MYLLEKKNRRRRSATNSVPIRKSRAIFVRQSPRQTLVPVIGVPLARLTCRFLDGAHFNQPKFLLSLFPIPIVPSTPSVFDYCKNLMTYPSGASADQRVDRPKSVSNVFRRKPWLQGCHCRMTCTFFSYCLPNTSNK